MNLTLFACGDVVNYTANSKFIDNELKRIVQNCDISVCNFEAPIKQGRMNPIKKAGPHVYQSKESVRYLKEAGFDMLSIANNHIYDYGDDALLNTIKEIQKNNLFYIGGGKNFSEAYQSIIIEKKGIKIGFLAVCENEFGCLFEEQDRGGYSWIFHYKIDDNVKKLKQKVDYVVLLAHAGVEDIEIPIKEWRDRYQRLCDLGVDVVIGHHPHVPQGYEQYNDKLIFYSLGNFYFDTNAFNNNSDDSFSVILKFHKTRKIDFDIIYHKKINAQTCLVGKQEVSFSLDYLNSLLDNNYNKRNDDISLELFNRYYHGYYESALNAIPKKLNWLRKIKFFFKTIICHKENEHSMNLLLLHNIRIDSHRFTVQRALSLISETGYKA